MRISDWSSDVCSSDLVVTMTLFINDDGDISTAWKGRLVTVEPEKAAVKLSFESIFTSLRQPGLRARFQRSCRHALHHRGCDLLLDDFETDWKSTRLNSSH